jgi:glycosyltransferase involved in cell wall biosynthesis
MTPLRVAHFNTQFAGLGGVEAILRGHHERDAEVGVDSRFFVFWEPQHPEWVRAHFLNLSETVSVRDARTRMVAAFPEFSPDVAVYHTIWGWPFFGPVDRAARRVLYLHADSPGIDRHLATRVWWADGIVSVNERLIERVRTHRPGLPEERILRVAASVDAPEMRPRGPREPGRPLVLGFSGRIVREQKRVDRFPDLVRELDRRGIAYRIEFLGDGPERSWLEEQLPDRNRFVFHGRKSGADYWRILETWDAIVFTSDYEGTPLSLLEAMAVGVLPVHPAIQSGGDRYAAMVDRRLVYPLGDVAAPADAVVLVDRLRRDEADAWRKAGRAAIAGHLGPGYRVQLAEFLCRLRDQPPLERRPMPRWRFPMDRMSFGAIRSLADFSRGLKQRFKGRA